MQKNYRADWPHISFSWQKGYDEFFGKAKISILGELMQIFLNGAGLIFGLLGSIMVFFFGLPSIGVLNEGAYVATEITPRMRKYTLLSRCGLLAIALGFLTQFIALLLPS